jgi:chromosome segregation ATPase
MHSAHRDLETKFKRTKQDLQQALEEKEQLQNLCNHKIDEITELKSKGADSESKLAHARERIDGMNRDIKYKAD